MRSSCHKIKTTNKKLNTFSNRYLETIITSIAKKDNRSRTTKPERDDQYSFSTRSVHTGKK